MCHRTPLQVYEGHCAFHYIRDTRSHKSGERCDLLFHTEDPSLLFCYQHAHIQRYHKDRTDYLAGDKTIAILLELPPTPTGVRPRQGDLGRAPPSRDHKRKHSEDDTLQQRLEDPLPSYPDSTSTPKRKKENKVKRAKVFVSDSDDDINVITKEVVA